MKRKPLQQMLTSTLISVPITGGLFYMGFRESNLLLVFLGGISLFSWVMSLIQLWRLHKNNQILAQALICPECATEDGLDFKMISQIHEVKVMKATMQEFCQHCTYESAEQILAYPLDQEIADLMAQEKQAKSIADRRAEEAWYRKKVLAIVSED